MESSGGPPDRTGGGPPPPPPPGSGGPPPPPPPPGGGPPGGPPGEGPQSPGGPWAQPGGYQPSGYGPPGRAQPGYAQPGYAQPGYGMVGYGFAGPPVLEGRELASWGSRVGAHLLDTLIFLLLLLTIVGWIFIPSLVMARKGNRNGQTWGKQAVGIRVIKSNGQEYEFGDAFVREWVVKFLLFGFIGGFFFLPPWIDFLWPLGDDRNQSLHDKMVDSYVVRA